LRQDDFHAEFPVLPMCNRDRIIRFAAFSGTRSCTALTEVALQQTLRPKYLNMDSRACYVAKGPTLVS
ncbi:MAG: hypothetical protein J0H37_04050, partial [Hyphomicrobium denitrificans]|nr:hypothetical protein [Hyphomicrobium denitrificans]